MLIEMDEIAIEMFVLFHRVRLTINECSLFLIENINISYMLIENQFRFIDLCYKSYIFSFLIEIEEIDIETFDFH